MSVFDHLGISVADLDRGVAQFDPVMQALGFARQDAERSVAWWREGETELILYPAREGVDERHVHGRIGWQHLAFAVESRDDVDRLHAIAVAAGWQPLSGPKLFPRFTDRYYATFLEDDSGIRIEFMHNPPRED